MRKSRHVNENGSYITCRHLPTGVVAGRTVNAFRPVNWQYVTQAPTVRIVILLKFVSPQ